MVASQKVLLAGLFILITVSTLNPNPFGNSPDIIGDESYFLTSALSGINKLTPPGLDFSVAGNYYGGPQTYLDSIVLAPVIGSMFVMNKLSLIDTKIQVALHTGDLLAFLRFVNSLCVVLFTGFLFIYFARRAVPRPLALQLLCLLFLLLGNSLIAGFVHTAKVWTLYLLLDVGIGVLFIVTEYYLTHKGELFVKKNIYIGLMVWAAVLAFFQNYVGLFPILLWMSYALLLKHIQLRDIERYLQKYWYYIAAFSVFQLSFIYRAIFVKNHWSWWDPGIVSTTVGDAGVTIDWFHRLYNPLAFAIGSQPLVFLYLAGLIVLLFLALQHRVSSTPRTRRYLLIACAHPVLIYIIFHVLLGFSLFPRYALPFTIACSLAIVMLTGINKLFLRVGLVLSGLLFVVVSVHSILLYWQPSSDVTLTRVLGEKFNSSSNVFIIEPDAWRLSLPLTSESLGLLESRRQKMIRYEFLLQNTDRVDTMIDFRPTVLITDTPVEVEAGVARFATSSKSVWTISTMCTARCGESEVQSGTCFHLNTSACGYVPQEIHMLADFLSFKQLGTPYVVRKIH